MFPEGGNAYARPHELFAGRYAVDGPLPWGGVVTYYRARTEGTAVILCVFPMDVTRSTHAEVAFGELAQRLGKLQTRSTPRVLDAGVLDGVPYLAFEDTRGVLLTDLLQQRPLTSIELLRIGTDVLDALDAAHGEGIVHGDLTPQNVVVSRDGRGRPTARVLGLGALSLLRGHPEASAHAAHTGSGQHAIAYMAPELFDRGIPEAPADLYAVGALLHHLVTGEPPVRRGAREGFDDIPALPDVIARAMARHPQHRYPTAASMRAALEWLDIESAKRNPQMQDIAPWMETSHIGSVPVAALASTVPPVHGRSSHPTGAVLSTSGARPIPMAPVVVEELDATRRQWVRLGLLLALLGTLVFSGYWYRAHVIPNDSQPPLGLTPESSRAE